MHHLRAGFGQLGLEPGADAHERGCRCQRVEFGMLLLQPEDHFACRREPLFGPLHSRLRIPGAIASLAIGQLVDHLFAVTQDCGRHLGGLLGAERAHAHRHRARKLIVIAGHFVAEVGVGLLEARVGAQSRDEVGAAVLVVSNEALLFVQARQHVAREHVVADNQRVVAANPTGEARQEAVHGEAGPLLGRLHGERRVRLELGAGHAGEVDRGKCCWQQHEQPETQG